MATEGKVAFTAEEVRGCEALARADERRRCAEIASTSQCPSTVSAYTWATVAMHIAKAIEADD